MFCLDNVLSFNEVTRSIKVRLYPDEDQKDLFYQNMGCTRLVHNYLLNAMENDYKIIKGRGVQDFNLNNRKYYNVKLMELKRNPEYSFLYNVESSSLQSAYINLMQGMKKFLSGKANFPHFKSKKHNNYNPFRIINNNENVRIKNNSIKLAKYGFVKCRGLKRNITGKIISVTVSFVTKKWFASITFKNSLVSKIKNSGRVVGIDLGVKNLLTFSNGEVKAKLQMKKLENKINKEQKNLSRKKFKSKNWYKNKIRIQKLHNKMKNKRQGYIHQLTKNIVRNFDTIVIEDLKTRNLMKRTAKGEKNKSTLSKNIAHSAWYEIKKQLEYKTKWYGKTLIKVNPRNTSKQCNKCGHIFKELKLKDRTWTCSNCNTTHDRDINAAKNILEKATI